MEIAKIKEMILRGDAERFMKLQATNRIAAEKLYQVWLNTDLGVRVYDFAKKCHMEDVLVSIAMEHEAELSR